MTLTHLLCLSLLAGVPTALAASGGGGNPTIEEMRAAIKANVGTGSCEAAGYTSPPKSFRVGETGPALSGALVITAERPEGYEPRLAGFLRVNVPGQCTGIYYWDENTSTFTDVANGLRYHHAPLTVDRETANENLTIQALKLGLSRLAVKRKQEEQVKKQATRAYAPPASAPAAEAQAASPALQPEAPSPTAAPLVTTVYREVQVPEPSRLAGFVESRLGWLLLGVLVIGIVAGFATRGSGSRQIVISPEEHARAAAALEQRLRADAVRIQRLSSAVDEEEARFIQRVSAITGRS